jgi:uncharacterized membrane protein YeaQ/YmgE (transglycosylase-associated protein family)
MEVLDGTTIFWFIAIGLIAGAITKVSLWDKGVELVSNLIAGIIGSVVVGSICVMLELPGSIIFAVVGSVSILFILNVFHLQPEASH